jgi:hypothetical protein
MEFSPAVLLLLLLLLLLLQNDIHNKVDDDK